MTGLEYIDLMLLHAPYGGSAVRKAAWKGLVECVEAGTVRSIGVSNYGVHHLDELETHIQELEAERGGKGKGGVLSVGQWEIHPWCAREDIAAWCRARNVGIEAYSPLVRGERWGEPVLKKLADKYGVSEAQVLIRWSLQKGYIPLPSKCLHTTALSPTSPFPEGHRGERLFGKEACVLTLRVQRASRLSVSRTMPTCIASS